MYAMLFCFAARKEANALVIFMLGALYHAACLVDGLDWTARYFPAASAPLPFSSGALLYFWRRDRGLRLDPKWAGPACAVWAANIVACDWLPSAKYTYGSHGHFGVKLLSYGIMG
jgi:hypothetical protein